MKYYLLNPNFYKTNVSTEYRLEELTKDVSKMVDTDYNMETYIKNLFMELNNKQGLDEFKKVFLLNRTNLNNNIDNIKEEVDSKFNILNVDKKYLSMIVIDDVGCQLINNSIQDGTVCPIGKRILDNGLFQSLINLIYKPKEEEIPNKLENLNRLKNVEVSETTLDYNF